MSQIFGSQMIISLAVLMWYNALPYHVVFRATNCTDVFFVESIVTVLLQGAPCWLELQANGEWIFRNFLCRGIIFMTYMFLILIKRYSNTFYTSILWK